MALTPSPDHSRGEIALWVAAGEAPRAQELLDGLGLNVSV
jgi:hypothetical protein